MRQVDHPNFGLMLDSLHVASHGLPLDAIDGFDAAKILLVELCDWPRTQLSPFEIARHYRLFPGEGVAPLTEFVRRLEAIGYTGCYSVEVMNDHYLHDNPDAVARRAFEATLRMVAEI